MVMGRPRSFDTDKALDDAMEVFWRHGYDGASLAMLTKAMGIKPPSLYAAFGSKAGLFERALRRYAEGEANLFARARAGGGTVAEILQRTLLEAAHSYPERGGVAGCLVLDGARNSADPQARALALAAKAAARAAMRDVIAAEAPDRAEELADFMATAMAGMSAEARDGAGPERLLRFAELAGAAVRRELEGGLSPAR